VNVQHVEPINDLRPHEDSALCPCHPNVAYVEQDGGVVGRLVIHNAFDKRELREGKAQLPKTP
jgi:hypothetical protein